MSHHLNNLAAVYLLIVTISCNGMGEKPSILNTLIPKGAYPDIQFITNERVILNNNYFCLHEGCYLVDIKKNKLITKVAIGESFRKHGDRYYWITLAMHPNKKTFSLCQCSGIALYDTETATLQKSISLPFHALACEATFSPSDDTILCLESGSHTITQWNYTSNQLTIIDHFDMHAMTPRIEMHPTQRKVCMSSPYQNITIFEQNDFSTIKQIDKKNCDFTYPYARYSPDGSFIVVCYRRLVDIIHSDTYDIHSSYTCDETHTVKEVAFHPNNILLTIFLKPDNIIHYFDLNTKSVIAQIPTHLPDTSSLSELSFSPNGKQLIAMLDSACKITNLPFEAHNSKEKMLLSYILFSLKNYSPDQYNQLPRDVIQLLILTVLETLKYSA